MLRVLSTAARLPVAVRCMSSVSAEAHEAAISTVNNRNPHSSEILGTKPKRLGLATSPEKAYYYRLRVDHSNKHTTAWVDYSTGDVIMAASTKEEAIAKHLYSTSDKSASQNIGRVIAQRLQEAGITKVHWHMAEDKKYHGKVKAFIDAVRDSGISMKE